MFWGHFDTGVKSSVSSPSVLKDTKLAESARGNYLRPKTGRFMRGFAIRFSRSASLRAAFFPLRIRSVDRSRNHLFRSARNCGPVRRKVEHDRNDYPRPLRKNPDWPWNKPRPNLFHWWIFRPTPDSVGRPRCRLGAGPDECSGWPSHRPWDRTIRSVSR
jgi:hypothetical protein